MAIRFMGNLCMQGLLIELFNMHPHCIIVFHFNKLLDEDNGL